MKTTTSKARIVAFLTDFGLKDHYVGVMKGVLLTLAPETLPVDLTHEVPPQDIATGAYLLGVAYRYFPKGTIFVAVVDPGVGTARRGLCVVADERFFVGPDNGLFTLIYQQARSFQTYALENRSYFLSNTSHTFHGRDVFTPVAAHLARGLPPRELGPAINDPVLLPWPKSKKESNGICGVVIHVDRFGNLVTNITAEDLSSHQVKEVHFANHSLPFCCTYAEVPEGTPLALLGSDGFLEIAVATDSAAKRLGRKGEVRVVWA